VRRASEADRAKLNGIFADLCRIESPSGHERACADRVTEELRDLGLAVEEDDAGPVVGADAGNLLARLPGPGPESILLCAHLDTVPPLAPIDPVIVDGGWENAGEGILGADNKAAIAVLLELARRFASRGEEPPIGVEFLFTVSEENGLRGARAFDTSRLSSKFGYVFDHASPIGGIVVAAPTYDQIVAVLHGRAAHAGIRPEQGRSAILAAARAIAAMRLGRLDEETTANVGTIVGGTATNVVPERCRLEAEVRGLDDARVAEVVTEMVDHLHDAANAAECDLDVTVERQFQGYRSKPSAPQVVAAARALQACGYEPHHLVTGGGSDANAFQAAGLPCANLADGTERNHEPGERVSTDALEGMLEVAIALLDAVAEVATP
jgi:tripeptide aminopeptidase